MRITPIFIGVKNTVRTNSQVKNKGETRNVDSNNLMLSNFIQPYFINFKGYAEDKKFIIGAEQLLENMIYNVDSAVRDNLDYGSDDYFDALNIVEKDIALYKKIISSPLVFNGLQKEFNLFKRLVIDSIDDVKYNNKHFTKFWEDNCKIGDEKISDIVRSRVESSNLNINSIIKNSSIDDYSKIKDEIIKKWFSFSYEKFEKKRENNGIEKNLKKLEQYIGKEDVVRFVRNSKNSLTNSFNNSTKEKILSINTTTEQKLSALESMLSFVYAKLLEDKGSDLEKDFCILNQVRKQLNYAKEKEAMLFAKDAIRSLHSLAFKKWENDNLNFALNSKMDKEIFIKQEEQKNPKLRYCQNYPNFNTDEKYFVARYFNIRYKTDTKYDYDKDDYLWQIINDRHNAIPARESVREMVYSIKNNQDTYFEKLDSIYKLLEDRQYFPDDFNLPERKVEAPDDDLSFCDLYINKLDKYDKFKRKSESEKLDYLSKLTLSEMVLLNSALKQDWLKTIQPYAIIEEVNRQARNTSIFKKMFEELQKINSNLTEIKIKTDDISLSLKDALVNRATFTNYITDETPVKLSQQISDLQRTYNNLPDEAKASVDKDLLKSIPEIQKAVSTNKSDGELEKTILELSQIQKEKNPTNHFLDMVQRSLIFSTISSGMTSGKELVRNIGNGIHSIHKTLPTTWNTIGSSTYNEFSEIMSPFTPTDVISHAVPGVALASAGGGSGFNTLLTAASANPYVAIATIATAVCGGLIIHGANQASKLEKNQRNLVFAIEI